MRHTLTMPGIDAEMREFGQAGIRKGERTLLATNTDEIDTLLTMLKLRDDWQGREMAISVNLIIKLIVCTVTIEDDGKSYHADSHAYI